jgi:L-amino acid N-acyltransferase YncA
MLSEYILEREGIQTLEYEHGFCTYDVRADLDYVYIVDIYVRKSCRKAGLAAKMADEVTSIARENGCHFLLGSVDPRTNGATASTKVLLAYGFEVSHIDGQLLMFKKEIS